jgi:hypothetical protein
LVADQGWRQLLHVGRTLMCKCDGAIRRITDRWYKGRTMDWKHNFHFGTHTGPTPASPAGVARHPRELQDPDLATARGSGGLDWRRWLRAIRAGLDAAAAARREWRRFHI